MLYALTNDELALIVVPHGQQLCSIHVSNLLDIKFSSSKPLLFVIENSVVRVIDFRALREAVPIEGGYRQLCYVDSLD